MIEEDEAGISGAHGGVDLVELAGANEGGGVGPWAMLHEDGGDLGAGGTGELLELGEREIELEVTRKRWLGSFGAGFAASSAIQRRGCTCLAGRGRDALASAGEVDGNQHGAFTRNDAFTRACAHWAATASLGGYCLRAC